MNAVSLPTSPIPAPGFDRISGRAKPPDGSKYMVQFANGYVDTKHAYTRDQLRWLHTGSDWDVAAVRKVG